MSGKYDYIFAGMGCATLSVLMRMINSGKFTGKRILVIDREQKNQNDRTWCFWETEPGFFEDIVFRRWTMLDFHGLGFSKTLDIQPYVYKMIRGDQFYAFCLDKVSKEANIDIVYGDLQSIRGTSAGVMMILDGQPITLGPATVFSSIPRPANKDAIRLLQHFKGWVIETPANVFDPARACLMDFRVTQKYGTAFVYVLPVSEKRALVEFTLLTGELLSPGDYDAELGQYISQFVTGSNYQVLEGEFGIIPMTSEKLSFYGDGIFYIGGAGGQTKASSGYTFQFIQKHSDTIVDCLINGCDLRKLPATPSRFRFYDNTLLRILHYKMLPGALVFSELFKKNKPRQVLRFLDNESSLSEELGIISSLPKWPFTKAALGIR